MLPLKAGLARPRLSPILAAPGRPGIRACCLRQGMPNAGPAPATSSPERPQGHARAHRLPMRALSMRPLNSHASSPEPWRAGASPWLGGRAGRRLALLSRREVRPCVVGQPLPDVRGGGGEPTQGEGQEPRTSCKEAGTAERREGGARCAAAPSLPQWERPAPVPSSSSPGPRLRNLHDVSPIVHVVDGGQAIPHSAVVALDAILRHRELKRSFARAGRPLVGGAGAS
jgi:hypothetical protein